MPAGAFVTPILGASILQVWQPAPGDTVAQADAKAPFALGTVGLITPKITAPANNRTWAKFCRCSAIIAIAGTSGIGTDGIAAGAGVYVNDTGVALAIGDYVWLTAGVTVALAADEELAPPPPSRAAKAGETAEEKALREAEEAEYQKAERERDTKKVRAHA